MKVKTVKQIAQEKGLGKKIKVASGKHDQAHVQALLKKLALENDVTVMTKSAKHAAMYGASTKKVQALTADASIEVMEVQQKTFGADNIPE